MREMTVPTRVYLFTVYLVGALFFSWNLLNWEIKEPIVLAALSVLASLALIIKVEGDRAWINMGSMSGIEVL